LANILLYIYCFSLPYQAITIGGIAIVKVTGLLLSAWLVLELGFRKFNKTDLLTILLICFAPIYLIIIETIRTSVSDSINFYSTFISNILLFVLMIFSSHALNFKRGLMVLVASSFIVPLVMISPFSDVGEDGRLSALGLNANFSAILLSLSFMYLSIKARQQKTNLSSVIIYCLALIPLLGVIGTGTRFGLLVCALFICIFFYKTIASKFGVVMASMATALVMSAGIFFAIGSDLVVIIRLLELSETFTTEGRFVLWGLAIDSVGGNYITGIGPNAFSDFIVPIMGSYMSPHNVFFEFYIYGGLVGTILTLPIVNITISGLRSNLYNSKDTDLVYFTSIILITIIMLHHIVFNKLFWFLLAFVYHSCFEFKLSYENTNPN